MELHSEYPSSSKEQFYTLGRGKFIPRNILFYEDSIRKQEDRLDPWRESTAQKIKQFVKWAPTFLQDRLFYTPFCEKEGEMTESITRTPIGEIKALVPKIPFREQTPEGLVGDLKWQEFMAAYTPPREELIQAVKQVLSGIPRKDARYDTTDIRLFDNLMRIGSYKIALALIPNLTDPEVKYLFGNQRLSLAEIQNQIATQQEE